MTTQILIAFLNTQAGQDIAVGLSTALVAGAARWAEKALLASRRAAPLAILPEIAAKAVDDGIRAAASAPPEQRMQLAIAAARAELVAQFPTVEKTFDGFLTELVAGHVALQQIAPGGSTVNLPNIGGGK